MLYELSCASGYCKKCGGVLHQKGATYHDHCKPSSIGYIYFISGGAEGLIKIGYTGNLRRRIAGLRSQSPVPLRVLLVLQVADAPATEKAIHDKFKQYRVHGEYFKPEKCLIEYIVSKGGSLQ